ncbi:MAG: Na+/H+ antiporter NhaC family protein [Coriobacteriia bacterium]|nr:Na+/H+ antiporter NhaC family protein [Coriobacteriia bacterium]
MEFVNTFWALVPPLVAIILALITKEAYSSLFVGIVVGGFLVAGCNPIDALTCIINDGLIPAVADNAGIFIFLVMLGITVALVNVTGAAAAFGKWAAKHIKGRRGVQIATFILGVLIFIDDYFNCLTVGSVMRPVTDSKKVSRAKLSYLIDATAAPICMIAPVSSWAAAVSGVAADLDADGITLFISAIPFNFYSLLTLVFVIVIVSMGFDYGPMAKAEMKAYQTGELGSQGNEKTVEIEKSSMWDMLIPVILLIVCCIVGMLFVGGFFGADLEGTTDYAGDIIGAFGNTDAFVGLPWGALIALVLSIIYLLCRRVVGFKVAMECLTSGFHAMCPAIFILTFAVALKNMTSLLGADVFVAGLMEGAASGLYAMLPAIIFLVAVFLAFSSGTSWGTFGILIPIVLPIFANEPTLLTIGISACLAGAVAGDHCSPISDTTIMASAGANVDHMEHVNTQLPYVLTMVAISFVCFVVAGFTQSAPISLIVGVVLVVATLVVLKRTVGINVESAKPAVEAGEQEAAA